MGYCTLDYKISESTVILKERSRGERNGEGSPSVQESGHLKFREMIESIKQHIAMPHVVTGEVIGGCQVCHLKC